MSSPPSNHALHLTPQGDTAVLTYLPLDPAQIERSVTSSAAGAIVSFVGYTRDEFQGKTVTHLEYESYIPLALKTMVQIINEARSLPALLPSTSICFGHTHAAPSLRTDSSTTTAATIAITQITIHHLLGNSPPLTPSLVISVASPHRKEAFYVCEWLLERVKERVQVWKREWYADGTHFVGQDGEGVEGNGSHVRTGGIVDASRPAVPVVAGEGVWKENFPSTI